MFVYKYIATYTESFFGDNKDEDFDPHKHRKIPRPTTYAETMTHMLKGAMGAGMLAMPYAVQRLGIIFGAFATVFIGIFATYCIQILIVSMYKVCKKHKRGYIGYPKCMRLALEAGPPCMRWSATLFSQGVDVMLVIWQLGVCAIFLVFVAENLKQIIEYYSTSVVPLRAIIAVAYAVLVFICFIKDLKLLAPCSTISNACTVLGLILVFFYLIEHDIVIQDEHLKLKELRDIPIFIGITLYALEAVGVMLALEYNMEQPKQFTGLFGLFSIGMTIIVAMYLALGVFGYLKYGAKAEGSITLNLPQDHKKAQAAKLIFAIAVFLSYPLQNFVAWQIICPKVIKKFKPKRVMLVDYIIRFIVTTIPFILAVAAPQLGPFMGLIGALTLSAVAVVFPAIMEMAAYYPKEYGFCKIRLLVDLFIIVFGTFCLFSGVYTSLSEIAGRYTYGFDDTRKAEMKRYAPVLVEHEDV